MSLIERQMSAHITPAQKVALMAAVRELQNEFVLDDDFVELTYDESPKPTIKVVFNEDASHSQDRKEYIEGIHERIKGLNLVVYHENENAS